MATRRYPSKRIYLGNVVGSSCTGTGALPVIKEVKQEASRRKIKLLILPTEEAIEELKENRDETNVILQVTC